jgi:hypothetical protein
MKVISFIFLTLLVFQFSFSQTEKLLKGIVLDENFPVQGVDVINFSTKKITVTNSNGVFYISVKYNDTLFFYSKKHNDKKIILSQENIQDSDFSIKLILKPLELEEIIIQKISLPHISSNLAFSDKLKLEKQQTNPKNPFVYDGTIVNGMDFIRMGEDFSRLIKKIFKQKEKVIKTNTKIEFKDYVNLNFNQDFFTNTLKLQTEEIILFIEFCNADSKSKTLIENINILSTMDFLIVKNIEFKKMSSSNK